MSNRQIKVKVEILTKNVDEYMAQYLIYIVYTIVFGQNVPPDTSELVRLKCLVIKGGQ